MRRRSLLLAGAAALAVGSLTLGEAPNAASRFGDDVQLRAMADELARSRSIQLNNLEKPYFVQYTVSDNERFSASASLGGLLAESSTHQRQPRLQVRVGSYQFDNTNAVFSRDPRFTLMPLDDDYLALRDNLWLWTDLLYKSAADQFAYKRAAVKDLASPDKTPDFAPAQPVQVLQTPVTLRLDQGAWKERVRSLSQIFAKYPNVMNSQVQLLAIASTYRLLNTEGTAVRIPQTLADLDISASTFAADGTRIWNHRAVTTLEPGQLPDEGSLRQLVQGTADEVQQLARAPVGEDYSGPVLFEGEAAAQMMAQVLAETVRLPRKPLVPPGANGNAFEILESVWASRVGTRVLPEWMSLVDDPKPARFDGAVLSGQYDVDDEGVPGQRVQLVDKGVLRNFLLSREPVRTFDASNGHGRLPGGFGSTVAAFSNLFVQVNGGISEAALKAQLVARVKTAGLKYGFIVRRLDFPSTARLEELQSMVSQMQKNGFVRTLATPILAFRVYPDGHEELVRNMRFREFSAKDLRDISAASDRPYVFNYVNNGSTLNLANSGSDATTSAVISPSLLLESLDLAKAEGESGRLPLVPSPPVADGTR